MAQDGVRAARQDGGEPASLPPQHGMAEGVDTAVEAVQAVSHDAMVDRPVRQADGCELSPRDHPELPRRERRGGPFLRCWCTFSLHVRGNLHQNV